jgi:threonine 3-dehydrogenase
MMWAMEKSAPEPGLKRVTAPIPKVGPKDVRIRVTAFAICGTDLHIFEWDRWAESRIKPPLIPGHEFTGVVESVGPEVSLVRPGDRVTGETHIYCGLCYSCRRGLAHLCNNVQILGVDRQGAFADFVVIPEQNVWKLNPKISDELAAVHDPLGNAVHTARGAGRGPPVRGVRMRPDRLFCGRRAQGVGGRVGRRGRQEPDPPGSRRADGGRPSAQRRAGLGGPGDPRRHRRERRGRDARDVRERGRVPGDGFEALANGGRVSLLGIPSKPLEIDVAKEIIFRGATVQGINGRWIFDTWYRMEALLLSGKLDIRPVITHTLGWDDFEKAVELQRSGKAGKIVLKRERP